MLKTHKRLPPMSSATLDMVHLSPGTPAPWPGPVHKRPGEIAKHMKTLFPRYKK
jgi:hypothetical protein